jgi:RHH-type transcriptional regulator, proline utilization regulon repressor / proline dehydrogenase / delta 1-pyrroline-5-carboxylate dehydrogenase
MLRPGARTDPRRDLDEAIRIQNASEFGLTGGIHSLDDREIALAR